MTTASYTICKSLFFCETFIWVRFHDSILSREMYYLQQEQKEQRNQSLGVPEIQYLILTLVWTWQIVFAINHLFITVSKHITVTNAPLATDSSIMNS